MTDSFVCDKCSSIDSIHLTPSANEVEGWICYGCRYARWHNQFTREQYKGPEDGPMLNRPGSDGLTTSFS